MPDPVLTPPPAAAREQDPWWLRLPLDRLGLVLGPLLMVCWIVFVDTGVLRPEAHRLAGILILTMVWWLTEPIPIPATGLLAVALACVVLGAVPLLEDGRPVDPRRVVLAPFGAPSLFFLLGGLFIGRAMSRHGLDRRLALSLLCTRWAGRSPGTLLVTVGLAVTLISMWISNTAACAMMCPVTLGIVAVLSAGGRATAHQEAVSANPLPAQGDFAQSRYASGLLLITAFGASVGGIATPIGTATNVVALEFIRLNFHGQYVPFLSWCAVGVPMMAIIFVGMCGWLWLLAPGRDLDMVVLRDYLRTEYERLGPWKRGEVNTLVVFLVVVALWVTPGVLALLPDHGAAKRAFSRCFPEEITALLAPVLLYLLPVDWRRRQFTLKAEDWQKLDWGTILLFGAGLSLGGLMFRTGLAEAVGRAAFARLGTDDVWALTAVAIAAGIILSEFTSNTAAASALLPVVHQLCKEAGIDPLPALLGVTLGASFGSALPVSTPPNAIVYSTGLTPVRRMIRAGLGLDVVAFVVIWAVLWLAWQVLGWAPLAHD